MRLFARPFAAALLFSPASLLASLLIPMGAEAYVPPGNFIVKSLSQKHASAKPVKLRAFVTAWDGTQPNATRFKEAAVFNPTTRTLRSVAIDPTTGKALFAIERRISEMALPSVVLFDSNTHSLIAEMKAHGIAVKSEEDLLQLRTEDERIAGDTTWLGRIGSQPTWVIGKHDKASPQLWVEKDTFLPQRTLFSTSSVGPVEVSFESHRTHQEFSYPKLIVVQLKGTVALKTEVSELSIGAAEGWPEFKGAPASGWTEAGNAAPEPLRNLIQAYYQIVR